MPTDREHLEAICSQALAQLAELRAQPKPSYSIDGQQVSWESYAESLQRTVDWCQARLASDEPFEFTSRGYTP
jgi:hypothetical protein